MRRSSTAALVARRVHSALILFNHGWESAVSEQSVSEAEAVENELEELDDLGDVDFDLDEVENKIAPLALAAHWRAA